MATTAAGVAWADPVGPTDDDHNVTKAVVQLLRSQHMSKHPLDNEIAHRFLDRYLKMLDPMKLYFLQQDVDNFKMRQDDLDELTRKGDVSFAYQVFNVFLQRVDECVKLSDEILKGNLDFTVDEEMVTDPDATHYAQNKNETPRLWRKRIKYDLLVLKAGKTKKAANAANAQGRHHAGRSGQGRRGSAREAVEALSQLRPPHAPVRQRRAVGSLPDRALDGLRPAHLVHVEAHARELRDRDAACSSTASAPP